MAISLHDATVGAFGQMLGGLEGVLRKGLEHAKATGADPNTLLDARLHPDMLPLRYQVYASVGHSLGGIEAAKSGKFSPPSTPPATDYAGYQQLVADAKAKIAVVTAAELDALQNNDVVFQLGDRSLPFTAEGFLMTFSLPNFFFHVTTAYDILRHKGVPLAKRDFLGKIRMKA